MNSSRTRIALVAVLAVGAAFRLVPFFLNPSLPVDDAMLSVSIPARSYAQLLEPLDYEQTAPPLFLWALRFAVAILGANEFALRLVPLLAGLAVPVAVWHLGKRVLGPGPALLATALAALSPILIRYSIIVKPYSLDALIATLTASLALTVVERPNSLRAWWTLLAGGLVGLAASATSAFALAGAGAAAVIVARTWPGARLPLLVTSLMWAATFGMVYTTLYDRATGEYLHQFWDSSFLTPAAFREGGAGWRLLGAVPLQAFETPRVPVIGALPFWALLVAGLVHIGRRHGAPLVLLVAGPVAAALLASALGRYPVSPRLFLFAAPLIVLALAAGGSALWERRLAPLPRWLVHGTVGLVLVTLAGLASKGLYRGRRMPALVSELNQRRAAGEPVYVLSGAVPEWTWYATDWSAPDRSRLRFLARVAGPGGPAFHNAAGRGRAVRADEGAELILCTPRGLELIGLSPGVQRRDQRGFTQRYPDPGWAEREAARIRDQARPFVWLVLSHAYPRMLPRLFGALKRAGGVRVEGREWRGTALYRYRFPGAPADSAARVAAGCTLSSAAPPP